MNRSFGSKLVVAFLLVISLLLILLGGLGYVKFKSYYLNNLESQLTMEAFLIADMTKNRAAGSEISRSYQDICETAAKDSATRVTIINTDGVVLGDSAVEWETLDNHSNRPEVYTALHGQVGVDIRYSDTLKMNMLYVAVPFNSEISGAVRMAMPLMELQAIYSNALVGILLAALLCGLLALVLSFILARHFSSPLRNITAAVQDMAGGNLKRRIVVQSTDEMGILAQAFNDMGRHIENSIYKVSEVKNRLEAILSNTVNGILMIGDGDGVVYANPAAICLLGLGENFMGRKYIDIISTYEILDMIDEVKRSRESVKRNVVLHTLGARIIEANVVSITKPVLDRQDILLVLNDITELKRLEQVRKDFVANVSHELKTPVASISGFAETLLSEGGIHSDNSVEFTQIIYDEAQRLARLINDLLELSKLEAEESYLNMQTIDMDQLVCENVERMAKVARLRNIEIKYYQPPEAIELMSDVDSINQILSNLLDNAIKYSTDQGLIEVKLEELNDQVKVSVSDCGIGIPKQEIPRIFERFYRVDKARSRKTGGTGLGLAIVKHLVENLKGHVSVASIEGQGSTFSFTLPKKVQ